MMESGDLLDYMGFDARKWAEKFCEIISDGRAIDEDMMVGWFANALMVGYDKGRGVEVTRLPDGSAFIVD